MRRHKNDNTCPFCSESIRETVFLESGKFIAAYNMAPVFPGHSLVIPKEHITSLSGLTDEDLYMFVRFSRQVIKVLSKAFNTRGFNWILQEKEEAGQTVAHMHIHILPRKPGDLAHPGDWYPRLKYNINDIIDSDKRRKLTTDEIRSVVKKLQSISKEVKE